MPNPITNRKVIHTGPRSQYDPDALAYFNSIGDVPVHQKEAINKRVLAFKANGTWDDLSFWFPAPSTQVWDEFTRELKNNNKPGVIRTGNPVADVTLESDFNPRIVASGSGFIMTTVNSEVGTFKTNKTPSTFMTLNDSCWGMIAQDDVIAAAGFTGGSFNSTSASMIFQKRDATNVLYSDAYNTTNGAGRARQTSSSGAGGNFIFNRATATDFKIYRDGTQIASSAGGGGSLPSNSIMINGYLNAATAGNVRNETIGSLYAYTRSLTTAEVAQENADWQTFMTSMKRTGTYTKSIIWSGNSHSVMFYGAMHRKMHYNFATAEWFWRNCSKHGRTTTQINAAVGSEVQPFLDATRGTNYVFLWEATNDISAGVTGALAWVNYGAYADAIRTYCTTNSIPVHIVAVPSLAREFPGNDTAILETNEFNELLRDNWVTKFDSYTGSFNSNLWIWRDDYGSDASYITAVRALCQDTDYYDGGGTHLTKTAYLNECAPVFINHINTN